MRSKRAKKRPIKSEPIYKSKIVNRMINTLMISGKRSVAEKIVYSALARLSEDRKEDVVGPVCESGDFFAQDRVMPGVVRGDLLAVMCAGAYGFVLSSNYNARLRAAEVMVDDGSLRLIRERERLEDL